MPKLLPAIILMLAPAAASAADCPTAQTASKGFTVERGGSAKTEIVYAGSNEVRTLTRVGGETVLEVTLFQGLFELDRLDRGRRAVFEPKSDLAKAFPPVPGKKLTAIFEETEGRRKGELQTLQLDVLKKTDTLQIGACKYKVLLIDRSRLDDKSKPVFMHTDYYAPDLKLILAKEYRERDGQTNLIKYDRIYPSPR